MQFGKTKSLWILMSHHFLVKVYMLPILWQLVRTTHKNKNESLQVPFLVRKAGKYQRSKKRTKIYVGRALTLHIFCFILIDYAWIILAQSLVVWADITTFCIFSGIVQGQPPNTKQNHTTKNFAKFPNHYPQLTMSRKTPPLSGLC